MRIMGIDMILSACFFLKNFTQQFLSSDSQMKKELSVLKQKIKENKKKRIKELEKDMEEIELQTIIE